MSNAEEQISSIESYRRKLLNEEAREKINDILRDEYRYLVANGITNEDRETNDSMRDVLEIYEFINKIPMEMRRISVFESSRRVKSEMAKERMPSSESSPRVKDYKDNEMTGGRRRKNKTKKSSRRRHR